MLKGLVTNKKRVFDVTIFQTPRVKETKGYRQVYRLEIEGTSHEECLYSVFRKFNVKDLIPNDYEGRFLFTGDIVFIDEGRLGQYYYQLKTGGWANIHRLDVRR